MMKKYTKKTKKTQTRKVVAPKLAAAIRQITRGVAETKSLLTMVSQGNIFPDTVYAQNLNSYISQGITSESIIGEKLFIKNIHLKLRLSSFNNAIATNGRLNYRLLVIKTKKALTTTYTTITGTDVFRNASDAATLGHVDLHKVDLLYDRKGSIVQPNQQNVNEQISVDINIPVNRTHWFDTDNGGYFKDKNYYLIWTATKPDTPAANIGFMSSAWSVNFKDD